MQRTAVWDEIFSNQSWGKYPAEDLIRFIARNYYGASDRAAITLLEIGCGPGANLWFAAREGFTVIGIDSSRVAVGQAIARLDTEVPNWRGRVVVADGRQIPLTDSTVDAVLDGECATCVDFESARQIYAEAARVLKPGGRLFVRTFAEGCWGDDGSGFCECDIGPLAGKGRIRFTSLDDIPALLGGLEITHTELITASHQNRSQTMLEWIIHAVKR
jgi:SAM-dependent methyltransferase